MKGTEFIVRGEVHINCGEHTGKMDMNNRDSSWNINILVTLPHTPTKRPDSTALIWTNSGIWDIRNVYI